MPPPSQPPAMSQKIFALGLDVETVSLYLLCCAVADTGAAITEERLLDKWNGDRSSLNRELQRLIDHDVIARIDAPAQAEAEYRLRPDKHWH